jgi:NADPH:quinone reductase-like Zn-dependent oxidoreductase
MVELSQRVSGLSADKMDLLMQKLKRSKNGSSGATAVAEPVNAKRPFRTLQDQNYRLEIAKPGIFDTLDLNVTPRISPGPGQVELEVHAAGINFRDVMVALGSYPTPPGVKMPPIGVDCAGTVVAVGEGVDSVRAGDDVMCMSNGTFTRYLLTHHSCLMPKPANTTFEQASSIPCVFETVQYSLIECAHLTKGESVLIHSAAGGVGLAAIQVANAVGATIFATVGTPEKREHLRALGVEHIFDSRSLTFADEILQATGGEGVDVVLNSLAGEAILKGFGILRPWGRFLELGKRDLAADKPLGMLPFIRGISFQGIDLGLLAPDKRPDLAARMRADLTRLFREGTYKPLPIHTYPITEAASAFNYMMQGKHIGKLVFTLPGDGVMVNPTS